MNTLNYILKNRNTDCTDASNAQGEAFKIDFGDDYRTADDGMTECIKVSFTFGD